MATTAPLQSVDVDPWEERPTGGALLVHYPHSADVTLELVIAYGRPFWFLHVLDVPFEISAGLA